MLVLGLIKPAGLILELLMCTLLLSWCRVRVFSVYRSSGNKPEQHQRAAASKELWSRSGCWSVAPPRRCQHCPATGNCAPASPTTTRAPLLAWAGTSKAGGNRERWQTKNISVFKSRKCGHCFYPGYLTCVDRAVKKPFRKSKMKLCKQCR